MRAYFFVFASCLGLGMLVACGSSSNDAPSSSADAGSDAPAAQGDAGRDDAGDASNDAAPAGPTIDVATAAADFAGAYCAYWQRCFATFITETFETEAACEARMKQAFVDNALPAARYDEAAATKSVSCLKAASCEDLYGGKWQIDCAPPLPVNLLAEGGACNRNEWCASGYCNDVTASTCGACAKSTTVALGAQCDESAGTVCAPPQTCVGRCVRVRFFGESCDADLATASDVCGNGLVCVSGKCDKAGGPGASCASGGDLACDVFRLLTCDSKGDKTCVALTFGALNDACDRFGPRECGAGLYCKPAMPGDANGTCQARVADGQPCTSSSECTFGANCRDGLCKPSGTEKPTCH